MEESRKLVSMAVAGERRGIHLEVEAHTLVLIDGDRSSACRNIGGFP